MTKVKTLALLVGMVMLFTLPATVSAQRLPPHVFVGMAWIDAAAVAEGTTVTAWVAGAQVASTTTTGTGGDYTLIVDQGDASFAGETISFQVGGYDATQTSEWMQGGGDELTLSASSGMTPAATDEPPDDAMGMTPGATGVPGEAGPRGRTGATGAAGAAGARGATGATGSQGNPGADGAKGDTGSAGARGAAGTAGALGSAGPTGAQGDDGSNVLGIVALILAIIGIGGAGGVFLLSRRS